jgi:hypothetical protein
MTRKKEWVSRIRNLLTRARGEHKEDLTINPAEASEDQSLRETEHLIRCLQTAPGLWEQLSQAADMGKPTCISAIISICGEAGVLATDGEKALGDEESITIYSEHHEAIGRMELIPDDTNKLCTIVWALEGMSLKTSALPQGKRPQE